MPELPEVESVRRGLAPRVVGNTVLDVAILRDYSIRHQVGGAQEFRDRLVGSTLCEVARRGKFLWMTARKDGSAPVALVAHLGMSGQFRFFENEARPLHPHARVTMLLGSGASRTELDFIDQRTFGYLVVDDVIGTSDHLAAGAGTGAALIPRRVSHIARDILDPHFDIDAVAGSLRTRSSAIKSLLLGQQTVSGIGNIYADEALWRARVHPAQSARQISSEKMRLVLESAAAVMAAALEVGGTSFDALYVNVNGESGYFSRSLQAYGRTGEPCPRCGTPIRRIVVGGRSSHICPRCQRRR
ncbi:bifunctional DNA-formamidopyrimidine glycosylase/DNA-(apurinic or apyrimidinic site) lyase [Rarobacter incanus]|uniref:bifunctional DNA-formamidopyrimidine glycosylase/DNA-(apurinic or apyrimidinic site) lyase n=1 Tax=Rarobacter incanus TaxID=153494 RepID=UPI001150537C|nr:bifunctional DNA-formamidopyrimidine glycosylase/DNA-(apurinic or apyrimidinic site) lyase [Rarobacter incanus]